MTNICAKNSFDLNFLKHSKNEGNSSCVGKLPTAREVIDTWNIY